MKAQKNNKLHLAQARPLADYMNEEEATLVPKTIRIPKGLWDKMEKLATKYDRSIAETIVKSLTKICDEEGLNK